MVIVIFKIFIQEKDEGDGVRRGSVGSKGKWGQKSSVKKKKKRKVF